MPPSNKLTDAKIKNLKATGKVERHADGGGLYVEVSPTGGKLWRMKYRFEGKEKRLSFGVWPDVSLAEAREKRDIAKKLLSEDVDPGLEKKRIKVRGNAPTRQNAPTFRFIADEFFEKKKHEIKESTLTSNLQRLELDAYPRLGSYLIDEINGQDILGVIRAIEERKAFQVAPRVLTLISQIFRYALALGLVNADPTFGLKDALIKKTKGKFAAISRPDEAGKLMIAITEYQGSAIVRCALEYSALTFQRPGEIRHAEWQEIDFDAALWTIPAGKMKGNIEHRVPLSRQALLLRALIF